MFDIVRGMGGVLDGDMILQKYQSNNIQYKYDMISYYIIILLLMYHCCYAMESNSCDN